MDVPAGFVAPHPDNVRADVGIERGAGKRIARMRALKVKGAATRSCFIQIKVNYSEEFESEVYLTKTKSSGPTWGPGTHPG